MPIFTEEEIRLTKKEISIEMGKREVRKKIKKGIAWANKNYPGWYLNDFSNMDSTKYRSMFPVICKYGGVRDRNYLRYEFSKDFPDLVNEVGKDDDPYFDLGFVLSRSSYYVISGEDLDRMWHEEIEIARRDSGPQNRPKSEFLIALEKEQNALLNSDQYERLMRIVSNDKAVRIVKSVLGQSDNLKIKTGGIEINGHVIGHDLLDNETVCVILENEYLTNKMDKLSLLIELEKGTANGTQ